MKRIPSGRGLDPDRAKQAKYNTLVTWYIRIQFSVHYYYIHLTSVHITFHSRLITRSHDPATIIVLHQCIAYKARRARAAAPSRPAAWVAWAAAPVYSLGRGAADAVPLEGVLTVTVALGETKVAVTEAVGW